MKLTFNRPTWLNFLFKKPEIMSREDCETVVCICIHKVRPKGPRFIKYKFSDTLKDLNVTPLELELRLESELAIVMVDSNSPTGGFLHESMTVNDVIDIVYKRKNEIS